MIVFFIMEVVTNRGFKGFWKSILRFGAVSIVLILAVNAFRDTGYFGIETYVPDSDNVQSVTIEYVIRNSVDRREVTQTFTDKTQIESITEFHREALKLNDIHKDSYSSAISSYTIYMYSFTLSYSMKSGRTVTRNYRYLTESIIPDFVEIPRDSL